jgi:hypothetical protein
MLGVTGNPHLYAKTYYVNIGEVLTGKVMGQPASDLEERGSNSLNKLGIPFRFRMRINPMVEGGITPARWNIIGEVELDYLAEYQGRYFPFMVQGEISHFMAAWQIQADQDKVAKVDNFLKAYDAHPTILVPYWLLRTQEQADRLFRNGFSNGWPTKFY